MGPGKASAAREQAVSAVDDRRMRWYAVTIIGIGFLLAILALAASVK